jgi:5-methylcytosine-specific restriction protein B
MNGNIFEDFEKSEPGSFDWITFYNEIAKSILKYKDSRKELVELIYEAHKTAGRTTKFLENKSDIDPFTMMSAFNMSLNPESAELLQKSYADRLQVSYKLQKNNFLLPVSDNRNLDFLKDNDKDRIDTLWRLFEAALNYRNDEYFVECMNEVLSFASGKIVTISIVLYIIAPERFISLDKNTVKLIEIILEKTINIRKYRAEDYLALLAELKNYYLKQDSKFKSNKEMFLGSYLNAELIGGKYRIVPNRKEKYFYDGSSWWIPCQKMIL